MLSPSGSGLFSLLRADSYLLLDLTTGTGDTPFADLTRRPGLGIHSGSLDQPPGDWTGIRAAPIRPDGHVAWAGAETDDTALAKALDAALSQ